MKTKIITLLTGVFLLAPMLLKAQDCYIIMKIKGTIVLESTGQVLQKDDQICGNDNVIFKTADAVAIVHSTSKGKYTLRAKKSRTSEIEGVIISAVSSVLSKNKATLDTRSDDKPLIEEFGVVFCIIETYKLDLNENEYPAGKDNYFMIRFMYKDTPYKIKLRYNNNIVYMDKETIFTPLAKDVGLVMLEDVSLYYYDSKNPDNPKLINAFDLSFPEEKKLADELSNYVMLLKTSGKTEEEIQEEIIKYMYDAYGNVNEESFLKWVNENVK